MARKNYHRNVSCSVTERCCISFVSSRTSFYSKTPPIGNCCFCILLPLSSGFFMGSVFWLIPALMWLGLAYVNRGLQTSACPSRRFRMDPSCLWLKCAWKHAELIAYCIGIKAGNKRYIWKWKSVLGEKETFFNYYSERNTLTKSKLQKKAHFAELEAAHSMRTQGGRRMPWNYSCLLDLVLISEICHDKHGCKWSVGAKNQKVVTSNLHQSVAWWS